MADATFVKFFDLFNKKTKRCVNGCVEWTGYTTGSGYPEFKVGKKAFSAHRISYEYFHKQIPDGLFVRHKCDNKLCVNPAHLNIGTHQQNMNDMKERGRASPGNRKLSEKDVRVMRRARDNGMPVKEIAAMFGVSRSTASKVCSGFAYAHVKTNID